MMNLLSFIAIMCVICAMFAFNSSAANKWSVNHHFGDGMYFFDEDLTIKNNNANYVQIISMGVEVFDKNGKSIRCETYTPNINRGEGLLKAGKEKHIWTYGFNAKQGYYIYGIDVDRQIKKDSGFDHR